MSKLEKINANIEKLKSQAAKIKAQQKQKERKADTRRKILISAVVARHMEHGASFKHTIDNLLDSQLVKAADRELFGLKPKEQTLPNEVVTQQGMHSTNIDKTGM